MVLLIVGLLLLALGEVGFRAGLRLFVAKDEPRKSQIGGIQGAVLGLLELIAPSPPDHSKSPILAPSLTANPMELDKLEHGVFRRYQHA